MKPFRVLTSVVGLTAFLSLSASAQSIVSDPLGFNSVVCPANSDTIVGVPFRPNGSQQGALADVPDTTTIPDYAILVLAGNPNFDAVGTSGNGEFSETHYLKFTAGPLDGRFYVITANTADTVTIDPNGDDVSIAMTDDGVLIAEFWTLDTLFPPGEATTDPLTTPHAIVASPSPLTQRTQVLLPDLATAGINIAPAGAYYINAGIWKKIGTGATDVGSTMFYPDAYFIIRHPASVTSATTFKSSGEVEVGNFSIPLATRITGKQDNFIALMRPIDTTLVDLGLDTVAFVNSPSPLAQRDQLLVFNNTEAIRNKAPSATYYRTSTSWRKIGTSTNEDLAEIPAGAGFMIRKYPTVDGATAMWLNPPSY